MRTAPLTANGCWALCVPTALLTRLTAAACRRLLPIAAGFGGGGGARVIRMAAEAAGSTAFYSAMERPASGSAVNMLRSRRRNSAGRRRSAGAMDGAVPAAAMTMEGGATLGSQVVASARRELASAYLPPSGVQSISSKSMPPRQTHSAAPGSSWGTINAERKRLMELVLDRLVELRVGGALPAEGTRSESPLGQEDEVIEFLDVVLGRLNSVSGGERPPASRGSSRGNGSSPKSRRIAAAAAAAAAEKGDAAVSSAVGRAKDASQDTAARIVELEAELSRWKRECKQQRAQKQQLAAERVELANRLADVQFALKQHEHADGPDRGIDGIGSLGQNGDDQDTVVREKLSTMSKQLHEAEQIIMQLQQQNQQLQRESRAADDDRPRRKTVEEEGDAESSDDDLELEQLLTAAREARRAAEISQEGRVHEQSLTQHLAAARIQRRYREQSGRRVLRELRQAAAGTVQSALARPATAPGRSTGRPLTPQHGKGQHNGFGEAAVAAAPGDTADMGGLPSESQQAKIDADMAWLESMGMPVSQVEFARGPKS